MKLLVLLAAIYALIINQSLKQKERKAALRIAPTSQEQHNIRLDNNVYLNTSFRSNFSSVNRENSNTSHNNRKSTGNSSNYPFHPINAGDDMLYPLNFYYPSAEGDEGTR